MNNFPNGFKCYIDNTDCNKSYCITLVIRVGSCLERDNERGISHFLEHMLFKGTNKYKNLPYILDINGFQYNAMTMKECTMFYIKSSKIDKIQLIMDLLYQIAFHSLIDYDNFSTEKTVVMDEILEDQSNINTVLYDMGEEILFDPIYFKKSIDNYKCNITGNNDDIDKLTLKSVKNFYKKYYTVDNMFIVCTGNIGNHSNILNSLENTFLLENSKFTAGIINNNNSIITNRRKPIVKGIKQDDDSSGTLIINYPICGFDNINRYILNLYSYILTKGISSDLFELLRNKNGIVYTIESSTDLYYKCFGIFNISFTTNTNNILKALELIFNFLKSNINNKQLEKAKILYIEELIFSSEDIVKHGEKIAFDILYNCPVMSNEQEAHLINNITLDDINTIKNKYIKNQQTVIIHMSNIEDVEIKNFIEEYFI